MLIGFFLLVCLGLIGIFLNQNNIIIILMSIELILFSINLSFIYISIILDEIHGIVFSLFVFALAATEAAIGLGIIIIYFRVRNNIRVNNLFLLKN